MADFKPAFDYVMRHEGGYALVPGDLGGETYRGISRIHHPTWAGWAIVDGAKGGPFFTGTLAGDPNLALMVEAFYKALYWDRFLGDRITDQPLAQELMDQAVNLGVHRAISHLQRSLNLLNRAATSYEDIIDDGNLGAATWATLEKYLRDERPEYLVKVMNVLQGAWYCDLASRAPGQEKFLRGWLSRVTI